MRASKLSKPQELRDHPNEDVTSGAVFIDEMLSHWPNCLFDILKVIVLPRIIISPNEGVESENGFLAGGVIFWIYQSRGYYLAQRMTFTHGRSTMETRLLTGNNLAKAAVLVMEI